MKLNLTAGEPLYCVPLWDYAIPSFCSGSTLYAGTREMLDGFFDALERELWERGEGKPDLACYEGGILEAYRKYQAGEKRVKAWIAYAEKQLIHPAALHHLTAPVRVAPFRCIHGNIWNCPYEIRAAGAEYQTAYVEHQRKCYRFVLAEFDGASFSGESGGRFYPIDGGAWGHPAMLAAEDGRFYDRLMFRERQFKGRGEMEADMAAPAAVDFSGFWNDCFGDG